ncbi:hypothetical protein CRG98_007803 [Punica granatum]|uniref:Uncharacterized protein n=1 Tax=Punica granatum TaxID=22663 RepID=A0A2I0KTH9_PUNGR|nr:hypothetical protein CRG98_007803 [Punica granatum]
MVDDQPPDEVVGDSLAFGDLTGGGIIGREAPLASRNLVVGKEEGRESPYRARVGAPLSVTPPPPKQGSWMLRSLQRPRWGRDLQKEGLHWPSATSPRGKGSQEGAPHPRFSPPSSLCFGRRREGKPIPGVGGVGEER